MSRSLKKRSIHQREARQEGCSNGSQRQEVGYQDLVARVNDCTGLCRPHVCCA